MKKLTGSCWNPINLWKNLSPKQEILAGTAILNMKIRKPIWSGICTKSDNFSGRRSNQTLPTSCKAIHIENRCRWKGLYKIGGIAGVIAGVVVIIDIIVFVVWLQPGFTNAIRWFALFQKNWLIGLLDLVPPGYCWLCATHSDTSRSVRYTKTGQSIVRGYRHDSFLCRIGGLLCVQSGLLYAFPQRPVRRCYHRRAEFHFPGCRASDAGYLPIHYLGTEFHSVFNCPAGRLSGHAAKQHLQSENCLDRNYRQCQRLRSFLSFSRNRCLLRIY